MREATQAVGGSQAWFAGSTTPGVRGDVGWTSCRPSQCLPSTAALQAVRFQVQEEPGRLDTERGFIAPLEKQGSVIMNPVRQKRNRFRLGLGRSSGFADLRSEGGHV